MPSRAAGAGSVLDDDRLLELARQRLGDRPRDGVGDAAGRERHDHRDRLVGIARLRQRHGRRRPSSGGTPAREHQRSALQHRCLACRRRDRRPLSRVARINPCARRGGASGITLRSMRLHGGNHDRFPQRQRLGRAPRRCCASSAQRLARRCARRRRRTIRRGRCASSCRSRPAARPTSTRAFSRSACRTRSARPSSSTTAPAPARSSAPTRSRRAPPDGYTLLLMSNTHTVNESLIPNKPFQLMRDFAPVAPINYSDLVLVGQGRAAGERSLPS